MRGKLVGDTSVRKRGESNDGCGAFAELNHDVEYFGFVLFADRNVLPRFYEDMMQWIVYLSSSVVNCANDEVVGAGSADEVCELLPDREMNRRRRREPSVVVTHQLF
eukprot:scaffold1077_cov191-Alexandrium_tamarense.AAC.31